MAWGSYEDESAWLVNHLEQQYEERDYDAERNSTAEEVVSQAILGQEATEEDSPNNN